MSMADLLSSFQGNAASSINEILVAEASIGAELPNDYKQFLLTMDGGEGFVGGQSYLMLWRANELASFNADYESAKYCPGIVIIGSSGGGEAFAIDITKSDVRYVQVPFIGMSRSLVVDISSTFEGFLAALGSRT